MILIFTYKQNIKMTKKTKKDTSKTQQLKPIKHKTKQNITNTANKTTKNERLYTFFAYLTFSKTVCTIRHIPKNILIRDFKEHLVLTCGVPISIQRLHYLDSCELDETADLRSLDTPDNASFRLGVWNNYEKVMRCLHENDLEDLLASGFIDTSPISGTTKNAKSDDEDGEENEEDSDEDKEIDEEKTCISTRNKERAETCLFVACFLGRLNFIESLLEMGLDINCETTLGYTPLHAAVAGGHYKCIDFLLAKGAVCDTKSAQAKRAMTIAKENGHLEGEKHLLSFEWQTRAKNVHPSKDIPIKMHQQFDSRNQPLFRGEYSTKYVCSTLPRSKFSGTHLSAPLSTPPKTSSARSKYKVIPEIYVDKSEEEGEKEEKHVTFEDDNKEESTEESDFRGISFDKWLRNKKEQKILSIQQSIEEEKLRQQEKQEREINKRTKKLSFFEEQQKRKNRIQDDFSERNKISMHEEHKYLPNYQASIIHHYMSELLLERE